jgi:hypothetical protein
VGSKINVNFSCIPPHEARELYPAEYPIGNQILS